jgi:hypothetical protein
MYSVKGHMICFNFVLYKRTNQIKSPAEAFWAFWRFGLLNRLNKRQPPFFLELSLELAACAKKKLISCAKQQMIKLTSVVAA